MKEVLSLFTFGIGGLCFVVSVQSLGRPSPTIATRKLRYARLPPASLPQCQGLSTDSDSECRARGSLAAETRSC
jgi:hypothetical protein